MNFEQIGSMPKAKRIRDLRGGEHGFVVPWAFKYDDAGDIVRVDDSFTVHGKSEGTACIRVDMTHDGRLIVDLNTNNYYED